MSVSSSSYASTISDDPIIGYRQPKRRTNIDFREKLSLNADEIYRMRKLCMAIEDESEFVETILTLLYTLHQQNELQQSENDYLNFFLKNFNNNDNSTCSTNSNGSKSSSSDSSNSFSLSSNSDSDDDCISLQHHIDIQSSPSIPFIIDIPSIPSYDSIVNSSSFLNLNNYHHTSSEHQPMIVGIPSTKITNGEPSNQSNKRKNESNTKRKSQKRRKQQEQHAFFSPYPLSYPNDTYITTITNSSIILGCAIDELDIFVHQLVDLTAIRVSDWDSVHISTQSPKKTEQ